MPPAARWIAASRARGDAPSRAARTTASCITACVRLSTRAARSGFCWYLTISSSASSVHGVLAGPRIQRSCQAFVGKTAPGRGCGATCAAGFSMKGSNHGRHDEASSDAVATPQKTRAKTVNNRAI